MISFSSFIVSSLTCRPLCIVKDSLFSFFFLWKSNSPCIIYWEYIPFSNAYSEHLCQRSVSCRCVHLFLGLYCIPLAYLFLFILIPFCSISNIFFLLCSFLISRLQSCVLLLPWIVLKRIHFEKFLRPSFLGIPFLTL